MNPNSKINLIDEPRADMVGASAEVLPPRVEAASEEKRAAEKPQASEEIVIEEISIDGMCGVY